MRISDNLLAVNHGTLYPILLKLEQQGSITSDWGTSENNRRARYYLSLAKIGALLISWSFRVKWPDNSRHEAAVLKWRSPIVVALRLLYEKEVGFVILSERSLRRL